MPKMTTLQQVAIPCIDVHQMPPEDYEAIGEHSAVCAQIVEQEFDDQI